MKKKLLILICSLSLFTSCNSSKKKTLQEEKPINYFNKIYPFALRGDITTVFKILDTINTDLLNEKELSIKEMYNDRFKYETEHFDFKTKDTLIIQFVTEFQDYWKSVMLEKKENQVADSIFVETMTDFIFNNFKSKEVSQAKIKEDLYKYSNDFLSDLGYFSNAFGKTGHLYDLFLWKSEDVKVYTLELIDDLVEVSVHFMKDFVSIGWSHYTTFGRNYASGWATKEALYSIEDSYNEDTESFKVSYLMHEGQHFLDYKNFPLLKQRDLEYRAKLVELVKSDETTYNIIRKFIFNGIKDKNNAHGFANYCVIRDLSKLIFEADFVKEKEKWMNTPKETIKAKSLLLFEEHSSKLEVIGSGIVEELIDL